MTVRDVDAEPPARKKLLLSEAQMLIALPRSRFDEFTQAAFWAALATATSGLSGLFDILNDKPAQPKALDLAEIMIFGVCVALTINGACKRKRTQTADEYLNKLYGVTAPESKKRWPWGRR